MFGIRKRARLSQEEYAEKMRSRDLTAEGAEIPDPVPMEPPIGYKKQPSMVDHMRNLIRSEMLAREVAAQGAETFEEADDFDVDDDLEPASAYDFDETFEPLPAQEPEPPAVAQQQPSQAPSGQAGQGQGPAQPAREALDPSAQQPAKAPPAAPSNSAST